MSKGTGIYIIILFILPSFSVSGLTENNVNDPYFQKLEKDFLCVDGCGMALEDCSNKTAEQMRLDLFSFIDQGFTEIEIKMYMAGIYGSEVLREPLKSGFNLIVWITPFLVILAGFVMIFMAANKWVFSRKLNENKEKNIDPANNDLKLYSSLIDEERKKYF